MKKLNLISLLIISSFLLIDKVNCQNKTLIGIDYVNEFVDGDLRPGVGLNLARTFTERSSIEIGAYYRTYVQSVNLYIDNSVYDFDIAERHLSIPVLYKFSSRIINVYVGSSFEMFLDWKQKQSSSNLAVDNYTIDPDYNFGLMLKIGKDLRLADKLVFEPEIRFNPIFIIGRLYFGLGLNLKYEI